MTQDLDALPLPEPTHFRNGVLYAFSADQIRADRIKVWELAMRKAQEGREPVARVELMQTGGNVGLATRIVEIDDPLRERLRPGTELYTSPPPKSDEARDAWTLDQIADACVSAEISDSKFESLLLALAAQQKGGEA